MRFVRHMVPHSGVIFFLLLFVFRDTGYMIQRLHSPARSAHAARTGRLAAVLLWGLQDSPLAWGKVREEVNTDAEVGLERGLWPRADANPCFREREKKSERKEERERERERERETERERARARERVCVCM
jgi:hypothetical protein